MASASLGNGGVGSSRSVNGFKSSSSSVDWLGREMLEMRLRDQVDNDEDRVSCLSFFQGCLYFLWFPFSSVTNMISLPLQFYAVVGNRIV